MSKLVKTREGRFPLLLISPFLRQPCGLVTPFLCVQVVSLKNWYLMLLIPVMSVIISDC